MTLNLGLAAALRDVINERFRQIEAEGFDAAHDDQHGLGELARAGAAYALAAGTGDAHPLPPSLWPWTAHWWKPTSRRRDLVKAAALILAEIERLDRLAAPPVRDFDRLYRENPTS